MRACRFSFGLILSFCLSTFFALHDGLAADPAKKAAKNSEPVQPLPSKKFPGTTPAAKPGAPVTAAAKKERPKKAPLDSSRAVRISYKIPAWDKDPTVIDSGTIILKDASTARSVTVELSEVTPDAGEFSGTFYVSHGNVSDFVPEIYIPNQQPNASMKKEDEEQLYSSKNLNRKPFVFRKDSQGGQVLNVFNTKEEVAEALKAIEEGVDIEQLRKMEAEKKLSAVKALLEAAELAKLEEARRKAAEQAAKQASERVRMEELEKRKQEELKRKMSLMASAERARLKREAQKIADIGTELYTQGKFTEAEVKYKQANQMDPENLNFYYRWGITLYRIEKFQDALVTINLAKDPSINPAEKLFYMGLIQIKLKENGAALKTFREIKPMKDATYSPSAAFYEGTILFADLKYEEAKVSFQEVLDTSNDPKLDEKADEYIDKCNRAIAFAKNKEKKILLGFNLGTQFDSNILLDPTQAEQGTPTNGGGTRMIAGGSLGWRPYYEKEGEFSLTAKADLIYSSDAKFVAADPLLYTIRAPYKYKGMIFGKGGQIELAPGTEILYLDTLKSGTKKLYSNSTTFDWLNSFVMKEDWIQAFTLKYRSDKPTSDIVAAGGTDNDSTATKISLNWNNILFIDKKKTKGYITDLTYANNKANGKQLSYTRFDLGGGYLFPFQWETTGIVQAVVYSAAYPEHTESRKDTNMAVNASVSKPLKEWLTGALALNYTNNQSDVKASAYQKYSMTVLFSSNFGF